MYSNVVTAIDKILRSYYVSTKHTATLPVGVIFCQQKQLYLREAKKQGSGCAKKINVKARVLTSEEGHQELLQLCEEAQLKEQHCQQDLAQKAMGDEAQQKGKVSQ